MMPPRPRDEAGFLGTVAECIQFLDGEAQRYRDALDMIRYELEGIGHSNGNTMRALKEAKRALG